MSIAGREVARLFVTVGADITGLTRGMNSASSVLQRVSKKMMATGTIMTAAITLPLVKGFKAATDAAAEYEAKMKVIQGLAIGTGGDIGQLDQAIRAVGRSTATWGADALGTADAVIELYKSGQSAEQIFGDVQGVIEGTAEASGTLKSVIDLVAASEVSMTEASQLVIQSMAAFGYTAEETTGLVDMLVKAANASVMDVEDMAGSFKNAAPMLAQFGWSAEEVVTALALISQHGIAGSEAGTALKRWLMNMQRPTKAVNQALDDLGISLYDANGAMKDARVILGDVSAALYGGASAMGALTEQQRNLYMQTLFGYYGVKAGAALLTEGVAGWDAMTEAIEAQAGASEVAALRTGGFKGQVLMLKKAMTDLYITVGLPLLENFLTPLVKKLTELTRAFAAADPATQRMAMGIAVAVAAMGPLLLIGGALSAVLGALATPLGVVAAALVTLAGVFINSQGGMQGAIDRLRVLWDTLENYLRPAIAKLPGAWAAIKWAFKTEGLFAAIRQAFSEAGGLAEALNPLKEKILGKLEGWGAAIGEKLWEVFSTAFPKLSTFLETVWNDPSGTAQVIGEKIGAALDAGVTWLRDNIDTYTDKLKQAAKDWLLGGAKLEEKEVTDAGDGLGGSLVTAWFTATNKLAAEAERITESLIMTSRNMLATAFATIFQDIDGQGSRYGQVLGDMTRKAIVGLAGLASGLAATLTGVIKGIIEEGFVKGVSEAKVISAMITAAENNWRGFIVGFAGEEKSQEMFKTGQEVISGFKKGVDAGKDALIKLGIWMSETFGLALKKDLQIESPSKVMVGIGKDIVGGIKKGIEDSKGGLMAKAQEIANSLPEWVRKVLGISSPSTVMAEIGLDAMLGFIQGMDEGQSKILKNIAEAVRGWVDAFGSLIDMSFKIESGPVGNIGAVLDQMEQVVMQAMSTIERIIDTVGYNRIKKLRLTARRLKEIIESVSVDLSGIAIVELPDMGAWATQFLSVVTTATNAIWQAENDLGYNGIKHAEELSGSIQAIVGIVKPGIDAIAAMAAYEPVGSLMTLLGDFQTRIAEIVLKLSATSTLFDLSGTQAAAQFYAAAKTIIEFIKPAVDALTSLSSWENTGSLMTLLGDFQTRIAEVILKLSATSTLFEQEGINEAALFYSAAQSIIGFIEPAVSALVALFGWEDVGDLTEQVESFATRIVEVVTGLKDVGVTFSTEAIQAAGEFASAASQLVGIIGPGIQALIGLFEWQDMGDMTEKAAIFGERLVAVLTELSSIPETAAHLALTETQSAFWGSVQDVLGIISTGVQALDKLADYSAVGNLPAQISAFRIQIETVLLELMEMPRNIAATLARAAFAKTNDLGLMGDILMNPAEAIAGTAAFFETLKPVFDTLKKALDSLKAVFKLQEELEKEDGTKITVGEAMAFFTTAMDQLTTTLGQVATKLEGGGLSEAMRFYESAVAIASTVRAGMNAITVMAEEGIVHAPSMMERYVALIQGMLAVLTGGSNEAGSLAAIFGAVRDIIDREMGLIVNSIVGHYGAIRDGLERPFLDAYATIIQVMRAISAATGAPVGMTPSAANASAPIPWYGNGFDGIVSQPTIIGVGERGAERVTIQPLGRPAGGSGGEVSGDINVNVDMNVNQRRYRTLRERMQIGRSTDMNMRRMAVLV